MKNEHRLISFCKCWIFLKQCCCSHFTQKDRRLHPLEKITSDSGATEDVARVVGGQDASAGDYPYYGTKLFTDWKESVHSSAAFSDIEHLSLQFFHC